MQQIRRSVFETNSSSTHSITICTQEEYDLFRKNELMYDDYTDALVPYSSVLLEVEDYRYEDFERFGRRGSLEEYYHPFTTPSGDKMVAFGLYGYDG